MPRKGIPACRTAPNKGCGKRAPLCIDFPSPDELQHADRTGCHAGFLQEPMKLFFCQNTGYECGQYFQTLSVFIVEAAFLRAVNVDDAEEFFFMDERHYDF